MLDASSRFIAMSIRSTLVAFALTASLATAAPATVEITGSAFQPGDITVAPGTTVVWTNRDEIPHTVTSSTGKTLASKALDTGDHFEYTFATAGDYTYYCLVHPFMTGIVHVRTP